MTQRPAVQREPGGEVVRDRRPKPGEGPLGRPPRVHVATQRGPQTDHVQGVDERFILRVGASRVARDRIGQPALDAGQTVLRQVQESGDGDGPQRPSQRGVDGHRLSEKVGRGDRSPGTRGQVGGIGVPPATDLVNGTELGCPEQTYPGGVEVALRPGFPGAAFQLLGDLVIRSEVSVGQVPGAAFGLILQHVGPAEVDPGALLGAGQVHHQRPEQRMAERQRPGGRDPEDPGPLTRREVGQGLLPLVDDPSEPVHGAEIVKGDQEHQPAGSGRKTGKVGLPSGPEPVGERWPERHRAGTGAFGRRQHRREFVQGQRVTRGLGENPFGHRLAHHRKPAPQQVTRRADTQRWNPIPAGPSGGELLAGGGQHHRAGAVQPARDELHDVETRLVQPMRVVDDQQYRPGRGRCPEQSEHEHANPDRVGCRIRPRIEFSIPPGIEAKTERPRLLGRKRGEFGAHRQQHPAQATERDDVDLPPSDRFRPEHPVSVIGGRIRGDLQQGGEPDPWLSSEHQAAAGVNLGEEPFEHGDLGAPPDQHGCLFRHGAIGPSHSTTLRVRTSALRIRTGYFAVPDAQRVLPPVWIATLASAWSTRIAPSWPSVRVLQTVDPVPMLASTRLPSAWNTSWTFGSEVLVAQML